MALHSHPLIFLSLISLSLYCTSPTLAFGGDSAEFLKAHNDARKAVGVPPLTWNSTLTVKALALGRGQRDQNQCTKPPLPPNSGFNMISTTTVYQEKVSTTMQRWVALKNHYNYAVNKCDDPTWNTCAVYLQIAQRSAQSVGCSRATCTNTTGRIVVCLYYPPGKLTGLRPY